MPSRPKTRDGRDKKESLSWMVNETYLELQTIKEWGLTPKTWRLQPKEDRVNMLAFCRVKSRMEASDNEIMERKYQTKAQSQGDNKNRRSKKWH